MDSDHRDAGERVKARVKIKAGQQMTFSPDLPLVSVSDGRTADSRGPHGQSKLRVHGARSPEGEGQRLQPSGSGRGGSKAASLRLPGLQPPRDRLSPHPASPDTQPSSAPGPPSLQTRADGRTRTQDSKTGPGPPSLQTRADGRTRTQDSKTGPRMRPSADNRTQDSVGNGAKSVRLKHSSSGDGGGGRGEGEGREGRGRSSQPSSAKGTPRLRKKHPRPPNSAMSSSGDDTPGNDVSHRDVNARRPTSLPHDVVDTRLTSSMPTSTRTDVEWRGFQQPASPSPPPLPSIPHPPSSTVSQPTLSHHHNHHNHHHQHYQPPQPPQQQQQTFFSLSRSSTSSDVQSEVCLDLPDPDLTSDPTLTRPLTTSYPAPTRHPAVHAYPSAPYRRLRRLGGGARGGGACVRWAGACLALLLSLITVVPMVVLVVLVVPLCLAVRWLVALLCCCSGGSAPGCCHQHLTPGELLWAGRGAGGVAQCLMVLQRGLTTDRIRHLLDIRVLSLTTRHGRRVYPRFSQRLGETGCGLAWVTDTRFLLSQHVVPMPGYIETLEDLQDHVAKMAAEPLRVDRPLWEVQVLHDFRQPEDSLLLLRLHLAMADGTALLRVLQQALGDSQPPPQDRTGFRVEAANMSPLKALLVGPVTLCRRYLCLTPDASPLHPRPLTPGGPLAVAWSEPFSLSAAVRVRQVARCTLTELLVATVTGNIRTYLQMSGIRHPYDIQCALPVDFSPDYSPLGGGGRVGTFFSLAVLPLATNTEGSIPRLWATKRRLERFKGSVEAGVVRGAQWVTAALLPLSAYQRLWRAVYSRCTLMVSNLAGPESSLRLDSREVKCMMYWVPPLPGMALSVSFLTYADQIRMAVICDRTVLPNPEVLTRDFIHKLETVSKLLAHRRIPGEHLAQRQEATNLLSSYTLEDLTSDQLQLQMALVQQELHDLKRQLDQGRADRLTANDSQLCRAIDSLKARSRELLTHLRRRRAQEAEAAIILSEEEDWVDSDSERPGGGGRPFRRRTLSISSRMSTASVSSQLRPLSTASASNLPSPSHSFPPGWPDSGDEMPADLL